MWLMTKYGFYSIVKKEDGYHVRAREKKDLENLKGLCTLLKKKTIFENEGTDYPYRLKISTPKSILQIMRRLGETLDYPNFKDEIHEQPDQQNKLNPYFDVWLALVRVFSKRGWKSAHI